MSARIMNADEMNAVNGYLSASGLKLVSPVFSGYTVESLVRQELSSLHTLRAGERYMPIRLLGHEYTIIVASLEVVAHVVHVELAEGDCPRCHRGEATNEYGVCLSCAWEAHNLGEF